MRCHALLQTSLGRFMLVADDQALVAVHLPGYTPADARDIGSFVDAFAHPLLAKACQQLPEYLAGQRRQFDLPLAPQGTPFQQQVWRELQTIPYGQTTTYGELAKRLGGVGKARAVGGAAHMNPLAIVIPCHRLIGAGGKLTGFSAGLALKQALLDLEKRVCSGAVAT